MNKLRQTLTFAFLIAFAFNNNAWASLSISLISDHEPGPGARYGMKKVISALQRKGFSTKQITSLKEAQGDILIIAGIGKGSGEAANLVKTEKISLPDEEESLDIKHIRRREKNILLISGTDDRGLMYALLDVADRIGWSTDPQDPLSEVQDITEKPYVGERALSMYTMHRSTFESFFYDRDFWVRFLDMVAEDRYNTFTLIFGYENAGYFAPPYPFFFDLDEFPDVHVVGMFVPDAVKKLADGHDPGDIVKDDRKVEPRGEFFQDIGVVPVKVGTEFNDVPFLVDQSRHSHAGPQNTVFFRLPFIEKLFNNTGGPVHNAAEPFIHVRRHTDFLDHPGI